MQNSQMCTWKHLLYIVHSSHFILAKYFIQRMNNITYKESKKTSWILSGSTYLIVVLSMLFCFPLILGTNLQSHIHCQASMGGPTCLAGRLSPSERSVFMRLHESAGNNDKRLIIWDQADLLPNPTPPPRSGRTSPTPAWEEDESEAWPSPHLFHFPAVYYHGSR